MNIDGTTLIGACICTGVLSIGIMFIVMGDHTSTMLDINQGLLEVDKGFIEVGVSQTKLNSGFIEVDKMLLDEIMINRNNIHAIHKHLQEVEP